MSNDPDQLEETSSPTGTPAWRIWLIILASAIAALALFYLIHTVIVDPKTKPSDVSATTIFLYSLGAIVLLVVPWREIGLIPKKIGEIEFDTALSTQKKEQIDANVALQAEVDKLKETVAALQASIRATGRELHLQIVDTPGTDDFSQTSEAENLVFRFLERYKGTFFSPLRLRNWGSKQNGFSELNKFSKEEVTKVLADGVAKRTISVKVSAIGNTLYGISKRRLKGK